MEKMSYNKSNISKKQTAYPKEPNFGLRLWVKKTRLYEK